MKEITVIGTIHYTQKELGVTLLSGAFVFPSLNEAHWRAFPAAPLLATLLGPAGRGSAP